MPFPKAFLVCICFGCLSFSNVSCHETSENEHIIEWLTLSKTIPIAVSDMTATLIPEDAEHDLKGHIIIAGGCSHKDGNSEVLIDGVKNYFCNEVTDKAYAFNPRTETFTALSDLPSTRYRHAAAVIDGSLCLVGGRDVVDNIIKFIDVSEVNTTYTVTILIDRPSIYFCVPVTYCLTFCLDLFLEILFPSFFYSYLTFLKYIFEYCNEKICSVPQFSIQEVGKNHGITF